MAAAGIRLLRDADRNAEQRAWVADYFQREVKPLLTPIGLDPAHPFPQVVNKTPELHHRAVGTRRLRARNVDRDRQGAAPAAARHRVAAGRRAATTRSSCSRRSSTRISNDLFAGREVVSYSQFRVTRDADLWFDEEEVKNLRQALEGELPQRQFGLAVRLEVAAGCPAASRRVAAAAVRAAGVRSLSLRRAGQPGADVGADRRGRPRRAQVSAVPAGRSRPAQGSARPARRRSGSTTCCCTIRTSRSSRSSSSSARRSTIPTSSRSSRRCIAPASTRC